MNETELADILDDCLRRMSEGKPSVEQCLELHPGERAELEPLLRAASQFNAARTPRMTAAAKDKGKRLVHAHVLAHPRRRSPWAASSLRIAVSFAVLVIMLLLSTTAFAQSALPGQPLYSWKISSEQVWRAVAPDQVGVDLALADRRTDELTDVAHDPSQAAQALNGLHDVLTRLQTEDNGGNGPRIQQALEAHQKKLSDAGIQDKQLESILHGKP